ncbi:MAG: 1-acyl-sn-glycerol-3-phosphate acyltransferase [Oscillospiraceae bacterium]|nr:1-acyl-sn-glycerol-3-phosphate acyltransferase [Oscillospiraceae bacterium]
MRIYKILYTVLAPLFKLVYRIKVTGKENIPDGATVVCANHTSLLDPIFLCITFGKKELMSFMAKAELFRVPVIGAVLRALGAIPVNRGSTDISTLRDAISRLSDGKKVMIFPEGTRVHTDADASAAKTGAAMIACRAKVSMLPVYISDKKRLFGKVEIIIGKPIETASFEGSGSAKYKTVVETVFGEILRLGNGGEA